MPETTRIPATPPLPATDAGRRLLALSILESASVLLESRPGFDPANYASAAAYRADQRRAGRDLRAGRALLAEAALGANAAELLTHLPSRLVAWGHVDGEGAPLLVMRLEYIPGQYYPTEYRAAVVGWLADVVARKWDPARPWSPENRAKLRRRFGRAVGNL